LSQGSILDKFSSMIAQNILLHSGRKEEYAIIWPMPVAHIFEADGCAARAFPHILYQDLEALENMGCTRSDISKLFIGPARIANYSWLLKMKELMKLSVEQRKDLYTKLLGYVSCYRNDVLCRTGKNLIWSKKKVAESLESCHFFDISKAEEEKDRRLVGKLNSTLWLYTELLFFAAHGFGHEFHGPYKLGGETQLVVRQYYDLDAAFWGFAKDIGFSQVVSLEVYRKLDLKFDFFNRTATNEPLPQHLQKICLSIDGKSVSAFEEIRDLLSHLNSTVERATELSSSLEKKEILTKYVESHFYTLKPLAKKLGKNWRPPNEAYEVVNREEVERSGVLEKKFEDLKLVPSMSKKQRELFFKKMYDPRL